MESFRRRSTFGLQRKPTGQSETDSITTATQTEIKGPLGLNLLSTVPNPLVDLIFVHGLGGGSRKTWSLTAREEHFWPKEWLPVDPDFGNVRIHSFGYKADWDERVVDSPYIRKTNTKIVLVGHSMGGVVIKKALVLAQQNDLYSDFAERVRAMLFLATPHRGSDMARTLKNILKVVSGAKPFVDELDPNSASIATINEAFRQYAGNIQLRSFFETQPSKVGLGYALIVDKSSATLDFPGERTECLNADHRGICKFETISDLNYKTLRNALSATIDSIILEDDIDTVDTAPEYSTETAISRLRMLTGINEVPEDDLMLVNEMRAIGSCEWLTTEPEMITWRDSRLSTPPFFWLSGNAASGKSVLAGHVITKIQKDGRPCSYFFFKDGIKGRSTVAECLRSLAFQMAVVDAKYGSRLLETEKDDLSWDRDDERAVWRKLIQRCLLTSERASPYYWVLDGLDETQELEQAFGAMKQLVTHRYITVKDTEKDVKVFLDATIDYLYFGSAENREWVESQIITKSSGSFLWVRLIMQELQATYSEEGIEAVLDEIPPDMNDLYARMLLKISKMPKTARLARCILTWCVCAARPLTVQELQYALKMDINETIHGLDRSIATICGGLIIVDQALRVQLVHQTAKEYLVSQEDVPEFTIDRKETHARLAQICARFLAGDWFREQKKRSVRTLPKIVRKTSDKSKFVRADESELRTSFADYACTFFSDHLYKSSSAETGPLEDICSFLETNALLWIERIASTRSVATFSKTAKNLKAYLDRRAKHFPPVAREVETVQLWAVDLIRVAAKFRTQLLAVPASIHTLIPPLCPTESIIYRMYAARQRGLLVKGLDQPTWDDCLSHLEYDGAQTTSVAHGGRYFAVSLSKGLIKLYDAPLIQLLNTLNHAERVKFIGFSNDDRLLLTAGLRTVLLWDVETGERLWTHRTLHPALTATFTTDDDYVILACRDNTIRTLRVHDGEDGGSMDLVESLPHYSEASYSAPSPNLIVFADDLTGFAVNYRGKPILFFDIDNERLPLSYSRTVETSTHINVEAIAFNPSPEINVLIASYGEGELVVFDQWTTEVRDRLPNAYAHCLTCSRDGRTLVTGSSRGIIQVYDFAGSSGDRLSLMYHVSSSEQGIRSLAFSQDSLRFIDMRSTQCRIWEPSVLVRMDVDGGSFSEMSTPMVPSARRGSVLDASDYPDITVLCHDSTSSHLLYGKEDGTVSWCSIENALPRGTLVSHSAGTAIVAMNLSNNVLVTADEAARIIVTRLEFTQSDCKALGAMADFRITDAVQSMLLNPSTDKIFIRGRTTQSCFDNNGNVLYTSSTLAESLAPLQHPTNESLLLNFGEQLAYAPAWDSSLQDEPATTYRLDRIHPPSSSADQSNTSALVSSSSYIAEQRHGSSIRSASAVYIWPVSELSNPVNTLIALPGFEVVSARIDQLLSLDNHTLFFLDNDLWIASLDIRAFGATQSYKRHFFLLSEWRNSSGRLLVEMVGRDFLVARKGGMVVVKRGLDISEMVNLSDAKAKTVVVGRGKSEKQ